MAIRSSNEEYDNKLFEREIDCIRIGNYTNARTPILHEGFCGHQWMANPDNILRGRGCPACRGKTKKTTGQYNTEIKLFGLTILEEYINDRTSITHQCSKGHSWKARPTHVLRGTRCPKCMTSGFSLSKPAILYYVKFIKEDEIYYKVGVTNRTVEERFVREKDKTLEILLSKKYRTGEQAKKVEVYLLKRYSHYKANTIDFLKSSGNTELFTVDVFKGNK